MRLQGKTMGTASRLDSCGGWEGAPELFIEQPETQKERLFEKVSNCSLIRVKGVHGVA